MRGDTIHVPDPLITDEYDIPLSVVHRPQTDLPVWQYIHKLTTPLSNSKNIDRPYTHICILCSSKSPLQSIGNKVPTWKNALMRQRMSTNAVAHMRRVHPDEFIAIADHNLRKRNALVEKKEAGKNEEPLLKKKKPKFETKKKALKSRTDQVKPSEVRDTELESTGQKRTMDKTVDLIKKWLLSSGLSISVLQNQAFQHLMKQSMSDLSTLPTTVDLKNQVQYEFTEFGKLLKPYLAAELQAAMRLPFLCLRQEFRPIARKMTDDVVVNQEKTFFSLAIGFIDSQWRRVDLVLAAKEVGRDWDKQVRQLVTQTISKTYDIQSILDCARFHVAVDDDLPLSLAAGEKYEVSTEDEEDLLTWSLRRCVIDALGVGPGSSFGIETNVRRILRLLQELVRFFELPDRAHAPPEVDAAHDTHLSFCLTSLTEDLAYATSTSFFGAIANLLKASCAQFPVYWSYFNSAVRSTASKPQLEEAWTQLTTEDWQTVAEIEAILNHLGQFHLEDRVAPRLGAVAPSYAMLFRRLLSFTTNASSFKCYSMDELAVASSSAKSAARRKAKCVDTFTSTGRQCILQLRQLIAQNFPSPSTPLGVDDEIKAMLLDPRISSKVANLVTDTHAFHCAQEALRQEHRAAFELLATRNGAESSSADDETEDDDDDDDEISALLMVDGPKNQPPATSSTTTTGRRSSDAVAEDETRAWQEWQKVYVAWDTLAHNGADLFDKGQYNLLKLYHHVDILKWFRDVGQQAHPAASLLARIYLGQQPPPFRALGPSLLRFKMQEGADWVAEAAERAEKLCILHHNWHQYQQLSANTTLLAVNDENVKTRIL